MLDRFLPSEQSRSERIGLRLYAMALLPIYSDKSVPVPASNETRCGKISYLISLERLLQLLKHRQVANVTTYSLSGTAK